MRQLRSSLVSDTMSSSTGMMSSSRGVSNRATKYSEPVTAYNVAPKQRLNLVDTKFGSTSEITTRLRTYGYKESSKDRKRRVWQERRSKKAENPDKPRTYFTGWMYLPDLILEHIFKYLSYRERLAASLSCIMWQRVFFNTSIWSHLVVQGDTMCIYRWVIAMKDYEVDQSFFCVPLCY